MRIRHNAGFDKRHPGSRPYDDLCPPFHHSLGSSMSSNCPPQLHLTIPPNTTSFKRSFSQFGLDLSPVTGGADVRDSSGTSNGASREGGSSAARTGNERKRARSASSLSDGNDSLRSSRSSIFTASSDPSLSQDNEPVAGPSSSSRLIAAIFPSSPPRLPTPDIHDIEMPDYHHNSPQASTSNEEYASSFGFHSNADILPHARVPRSPTPPPILPPLSLSDEDQSAVIPFLNVPAASSHREDSPIRIHDTPPRLPSPVHPSSSPSLSVAIPASGPSLSVDSLVETGAVIDTDVPTIGSGYISFRERLNTAVRILEADDVSAFRDRLTSALDAVSTDSRGIDLERTNSTAGSHHGRSNNIEPGPFSNGESSGSWRASLLNNMGTSSGSNLSRISRIRNPPPSSSRSESRIRPLYQSVLRPLDAPSDSPDHSTTNRTLGDDPDLLGGYSSAAVSSSSSLLRSRRASAEASTSGTQSFAHNSSLPDRRIFAPPSNPHLAPILSNNELGRWFEDPSEPNESQSSDFSLPTRIGSRLTLDANENGSETENDQWASLLSRSGPTTFSSRARRITPLPDILRSASRPSNRRRAVGIDDEDNDDQDREDEDIIASLLSSTQDRSSLESPASSAPSTRILSRSAFTDGFFPSLSSITAQDNRNAPISSSNWPDRDSSTSSFSTRGVSGGASTDRFPLFPSLSSITAQESGNASSLSRSDDDDDVVMQSVDPEISHQPNRTDRDPPAPRRYSDVLSISDYRSQALLDARRRYIEQGLLDPSEVPEGLSRSSREQWDLSRRPSGHVADLGPSRESTSTVGYRLTAHPVPEGRRSSASVRWQFSWNDALDSERRDYSDNYDDDESDSAIRREVADFHRSNQQRPRIHRSSLFARTSRDMPLNRRSSSHESIPESARRSSMYSEESASGISSSLTDASNQRIRFRALASTRPSASNSLVAESAAELRRRTARADLMEHLFNDGASHQPTSWRRAAAAGSLSSAPPLPYQHRSPSPSGLPRSVGEVLEAADREAEAQERHSREDSEVSRRSTSLSWLPPPQFDSSRSLADSLSDSLWAGNILNPERDSTSRIPLHQTEWWRRRRMTYGDGPLSQTVRASTSDPLPPSASYLWSHNPSQGSSRSSARPQPSTTPGLLDSHHSLARTLTDLEGHPYTPYRFDTDAGDEYTARDNANRESVSNRPIAVEEGGRRVINHAPPSIPPPDLGALFSPSDIRTDPFEMTFMNRRQDTDASLPSPTQPQSVPPFTSQSSQYPSIDVDSFAPGPFRTTMQRLAEQNRRRQYTQEAPSIPPLRFDEDFDFSGSRPFARATAVDSLDSSNMRSSQLPRTSNAGADRGSSERLSAPSSALYHRHRPRESSRTASGDIHEAITRRARIEGSLIEGTTRTFSSSRESLGDDSFSHAIEVLRQDGLSESRSQQLIGRYRQQRDALSSTSSASAWGDIESNANPYPFTYRFPSWHPRASETNNGLGSSSSVNDSTATTRMGIAATRRRPSPGRGPDASSDPRTARMRTSRFGRHRPEPSLGDSFVTLSELVSRNRRPRGNFNLGDYMRDEDFDQSYEGLMSLAATLGEVRPRATPDHVVAGLEAGFYKDWASENCDKRCPICLDDYKALDPVLKLNDCSHWLHKPCLEQWLKGANTCPVCRNAVQAPPPPPQHNLMRGRSRLHGASTFVASDAASGYLSTMDNVSQSSSHVTSSSANNSSTAVASNIFDSDGEDATDHNSNIGNSDTNPFTPGRFRSFRRFN
ncbi:hypothetical protein D9757_003038 [Collybiopsis confluens]|uniref:RING-type domain-containing protein n=1 Tax=Collybiopsis confluens TaxID=2823264 RepID=A0A8H5MEY6_9AGAR|nr:hypothetical protein D9757_003038 [Collybiopsis confluens]